jgi:hypothetical protein
VAIMAGHARLIRPRMTAEEFLDRQISPDW